MRLEELELGDIVAFRRYKPNFAYRPIEIERIDGAEVIGIYRPGEYMPPPIVRYWYGDPESETEPDYGRYCEAPEYRIRLLLNPPLSENPVCRCLELSQIILDAGGYSLIVTGKAVIGNELNNLMRRQQEQEQAQEAFTDVSRRFTPPPVF